MDERRADNKAPLLQKSTADDPWARLNAVRGASPRRSGAHSSPLQTSAGMAYQRPMELHLSNYGNAQDRLNIPGISDYQPIAPTSFTPGSTRRSRPRFVYDQHRCRVCVPPLSVVTIALGMVAVGILLLLPSISLRTVFHLDTFEAEVGDILAYCLIGVGFALPLLSLLCCVWFATPTRAQWQVKNNKADALLEEMTGVVQLAEHYDVIGAENAANGTVILLAGASCPRITMQSFANAIGVHYRAILIDLPGHGSLVNVAFSLARSERVLAKVLERELHLTAGQLSVSGGVTDPEDAAATTGAAKPSAAVPITAKGPPAGTRPPGFNASGLQQYQGLASLPSSAGYIASPRTPVEFLGVPPFSDSGNPSSLGSIRASIGAADLFRIAENPNDSEATPVGASPGRENTAASVSTPKETDAIRKSVVIVSYGASAYVAAYLARRHPALVAGLALMGPIPDYNVPGCCTGAWESMYRLRWAASLVNLGIKGRIRAHPKATDAERKELLEYDWHVGMLPDFISEVAGRSLISKLRLLPRKVLFLAPPGWGVRARRALLEQNSEAQLTVQIERGLSDDKMPTLNPSKLAVLHSSLLSFVRESFESYSKMLAVEAYYRAQRVAEQLAAGTARPTRSSESRFNSSATDVQGAGSPMPVPSMPNQAPTSYSGSDQRRRSTMSSGGGSFAVPRKTSQVGSFSSGTGKPPVSGIGPGSGSKPRQPPMS